MSTMLQASSESRPSEFWFAPLKRNDGKQGKRNVEINVVDPFARRGYRFKGTAKIISDGKKFNKILSHYQSLGVTSSIKSIVIVKVKKVSEVTSPLYDLGFTEEELKTRWKKHYLSF